MSEPTNDTALIAGFSQMKLTAVRETKRQGEEEEDWYIWQILTFIQFNAEQDEITSSEGHVKSTTNMGEETDTGRHISTGSNLKQHYK